MHVAVLVFVPKWFEPSQVQEIEHGDQSDHSKNAFFDISANAFDTAKQKEMIKLA